MAITVNVKNGLNEVIAHGTAIVNSDSITSITISEGQEFLTFLLKFVNNESEPKIAISNNAIDNHTLEFTMINFNSSLGTFSNQLLQVGVIAGRYLYFTYFITHMSNSQLKKVEYCFYLGEGAANG